MLLCVKGQLTLPCVQCKSSMPDATCYYGPVKQRMLKAYRRKATAQFEALRHILLDSVVSLLTSNPKANHAASLIRPVIDRVVSD